MASPAPKSPEQSEKTKKYDRQLRLWGDHGQAALEAAHVCLINATGMGAEILKSLVLPGIGAFTIVDGKTVSDEDIGSNFFVDLESVGKSRAQCVTQMLLELNPDVRGDFVDEQPQQLFNNNPHFFSGFTVVVATAITEKLLVPLSQSLWKAGVPLIVARSYGFIGSIRIQIEEHTVVESHPDNITPDLRLDAPFPELAQFMDSVRLAEMDLKAHSHVPYLVPLYKCLVQWREEHGGALPATYKEKNTLKEAIRKEIRRDEHGIPVGEENFEEAIRAVNFAVAATRVPKHIEDILNDSCCVNLTSKSRPFWIIAKAVRDFVANEGGGSLPLRGALPDMTADTATYITLQQMYHSKACRDAEAVLRRAQQLARELNQPDEAVTEADVRLFCRHAASLAVARGSCIADEYDPRSAAANTIAQSLENPDSLMVSYVMLRGVDRFFAEYNTYPGEFDDQVEPDIVKLKCCIGKLLAEWGCTSLGAKDDHVHEVCRYGGAELHSVSSFIGGCAAQEVIKLITGQYKPIHNTFIYDAISSNTSVFLL